MELSQFDPFEILGVSPSATDSEIKKKYRKLSVTWHPDQWVSKPVEEQQKAENEFIKISKAYAALTDETSKDNYRKYGNPDGPQPMEVSLGLPTFLLQKQNQNVVLLIYILALVVVIPTVVFLYYTNSKKYSDKLVLNESYQVLAYLFKNQTTSKHLVDVLCLCAEYRQKPFDSMTDSDLVTKLKAKLKLKPLPSTKDLLAKHSSNEFVYYLMNIYLMNLAVEKEFKLSEEQLNIFNRYLKLSLEKSVLLLEAMQEIAFLRRSLKMVSRLVLFRQCINLALYPYNPHFSQVLIRELDLKTPLTKLKSLRDLYGFVEDKDKFLSTFVEEDREVVDKFLSKICIPKLERIEIGCLESEDSEGVVVMEKQFGLKDIVTVFMEFSSPLEVAQLPVYNPDFPAFFKNAFVATIGIQKNEELLLGYKEFQLETKKETTRVKLQYKVEFKKPGEYVFELYLKHKYWLGLDLRKSMKLKVVTEEEVEQIRIHPEDLEIEKSKGLMDMLKEAAAGNESEGEQNDEDSDFEEDGGKTNTAKN